MREFAVLSPAPTLRSEPTARPSPAAAEAAVRTLIAWAGDDPDRDGLRDTPGRVVRALRELCSGYDSDPDRHLERTFTETDGYRDYVLVRDIPFTSHCEHHMVPFSGLAHVAYLPARRIVGLSKLARVVEGYARRLQVQERLTEQIATAIDRVLRPCGVAVVLRAEHQCMTIRGAQKPGTATVTRAFRGEFHDRADLRHELLAEIQSG